MSRRLDRDARRAVLYDASEEARQMASPTTQSEHILLALAVNAESPCGTLLGQHGLDYESVLEALDRETEQALAAVGLVVAGFHPAHASPRPGAPRLAASAKSVLLQAAALAKARRDRHITEAHLLVGVLRAEIGTVPRALAAAHVDRVKLLSSAIGLVD